MKQDTWIRYSHYIDIYKKRLLENGDWRHIFIRNNQRMSLENEFAE